MNVLNKPVQRKRGGWKVFFTPAATENTFNSISTHFNVK